MKAPAAASAGRALRLLLLAAALAAAQGCREREPLTLRVSAPSQAEFLAWKAQARERMGPALVADFDDAVLEIGRRLRTEGGPGGEAVRAAINGRNLREVLQLGLGYKLRRLELEASTLEMSLRGAGDVQRGRMPGDRGPAQATADLRARQQERLRAAQTEVAAVRTRLSSIREPDGGDKGPWDPSQAPTPVPAEPPAAGAPAPGR